MFYILVRHIDAAIRDVITYVRNLRLSWVVAYANFLLTYGT